MPSSENEIKYPGRQNIAFILDDHLLFAESFTCLLKSLNWFTMVFQSDQEEDLWTSLQSERVTHVFLDYNIPCFKLPETLRKIVKHYPAINLVIISATRNIHVTQRMLEYGAKAFISKATGTAELTVCLRSIDIGRKYISPDIKLLLKEHANILHPVRFTDKEILVLQLIACGHTIIKTAELLNLSRHTIIAHRRNMMEKAGIKSVAALVKFGMDAGLISA